MKAVLLFAAFVFGVIACYLLVSLGVLDTVDRLPGTQEEPVLSLPTYLDFLTVMMTAVTVVLATLAIGIGLVAAYTFREIKDEAETTARQTAGKITQKVADERLSDMKIKEIILGILAKDEEERRQRDEWGDDPSESEER